MANRLTALNPILGLWRRLRRRRRYDGVKRVATMHDVPKRLGGSVYVVGLNTPKWVVIECPCRCGSRIDVNLMRNREPNWKLAVSKEGATLAPSLWMPLNKCGSHFFVRRNRVVWVA